MKLWMSADIEGVAGQVHPQDGLPGGPFYGEGRGWMTGEVVAACEAARAAGVDGMTIADGHGLGRNLILEQLPEWVDVVTSWPRPLLIAQGAETQNYDGAVLLGHHARAGTKGALLAHTIHGARFIKITVNGELASETSLHAAVLGDLGIPVIMVSGDDAYCGQAREILGDVETVVTKHAYGYQSALTVPPKRARTMIAAGMTRAIGRIRDFTPLKTSGPYEVEAVMLRPVEAELYGYLPFIDHHEGNAITFSTQTAAELVQILMFMAAMKCET